MRVLTIENTIGAFRMDLLWLLYDVSLDLRLSFFGWVVNIDLLSRRVLFSWFMSCTVSQWKSALRSWYMMTVGWSMSTMCMLVGAVSWSMSTVCMRVSTVGWGMSNVCMLVGAVCKWIGAMCMWVSTVRLMSAIWLRGSVRLMMIDRLMMTIWLRGAVWLMGMIWLRCSIDRLSTVRLMRVVDRLVDSVRLWSVIDWLSVRLRCIIDRLWCVIDGLSSVRLVRCISMRLMSISGLLMTSTSLTDL